MEYRVKIKNVIFMSLVKSAYQNINFYAPAMIMAGALIVTPVRPSVLYVLTYVRLSRRGPLFKSNTFDQNFMKLGHIV